MNDNYQMVAVFWGVIKFQFKEKQSNNSEISNEILEINFNKTFGHLEFQASIQITIWPLMSHI